MQHNQTPSHKAYFTLHAHQWTQRNHTQRRCGQNLAQHPARVVCYAFAVEEHATASEHLIRGIWFSGEGRGQCRRVIGGSERMASVRVGWALDSSGARGRARELFSRCLWSVFDSGERRTLDTEMDC